MTPPIGVTCDLLQPAEQHAAAVDGEAALTRLQAEEEVALEGYPGKSIAFLDKIDGQGWVRDPRPPPGFHPA